MQSLILRTSVIRGFRSSRVGARRRMEEDTIVSVTVFECMTREKASYVMTCLAILGGSTCRSWSGSCDEVFENFHRKVSSSTWSSNIGPIISRGVDIKRKP